jgi:hypothetical protein
MDWPYRGTGLVDKNLRFTDLIPELLDLSGSCKLFGLCLHPIIVKPNK